MNISEISSQVSPTTSTAQTGDSNSIVNQEEFLTLLVSQLQNQDPLNPEDPSEFTSQLTQFSSLEQLVGMNDGLDDLASLQNQNTLISATSFLGNNARMIGDDLTIESGDACQIYYDLPRDSTLTSMNVYDAEGNLAAVVDLGRQSAGEQAFQWNARDEQGETVADGAYRFEITAQDANGTAITSGTSFTGQVTGVRYSAQGTMFEINGKEYPLANLISVME